MKLEKEEFLDLVESFLSEDQPVTTKVSGGSMWPTIPHGAIVQICPIKPEDVRLGDVVLYKYSGMGTVVHRVSLLFQRAAKPHIQTWGDNNNCPDPPVRRSKVIGKITAFSVEDGWKRLDEPCRTYLRYFFKRYGLYYLRRSLHKLVMPETSKKHHL